MLLGFTPGFALWDREEKFEEALGAGGRSTSRRSPLLTLRVRLPLRARRLYLVGL